MLLLIDNYDSFTYNLVQFLGDLGAEIVVRRNDALSVDEAWDMNPDGIVISPGPCDPDRAGICLPLIAAAAERRVPVLGVCLGHQAIGQAFGGTVTRAPMPMHGKVSTIKHQGAGVFSHLPTPFCATRYHSLIVERDSLPDSLQVTAETDDGLIMGLQHKNLPVYGVQFHPESIASEYGKRILDNFLRIARRENQVGGIMPNQADFKALLARVGMGEKLSEEEAETAFEIMMSGTTTPAQVGAFLLALRVRGETVDELVGAARIMRSKALKISAPPGAIDCCGTGGDGSGTYNISTAVSFVVAGCGVPVAKHGNRAASSRAGAADVLAALGVNLDADIRDIERTLQQDNIGFMMAPRHHAAMRHVMPARIELGTRTIFNLMGPLSNPAGATRQLLGVFSRQWVEPIAQVLKRLGSERAWVVHGSDGLDEITTTGPTFVAELRDGAVRTFEISPADAGLPTAGAQELKGGDAAVNAAALTAVLDGAPGAYRDIVLLNSAAALIVAGRATDLRDGVKLAREAIDSGRARDVLARLVAGTNVRSLARAVNA